MSDDPTQAVSTNRTGATSCSNDLLSAHPDVVGWHMTSDGFGRCCGTCWYWKQKNNDLEGECRRHSPVIDLEVAKNYWFGNVWEEGDDEDPPDWICQRGFWPLTCVDEECGEYQTRCVSGS